MTAKPPRLPAVAHGIRVQIRWTRRRRAPRRGASGSGPRVGNRRARGADLRAVALACAEHAREDREPARKSGHQAEGHHQARRLGHPADQARGDETRGVGDGRDARDGLARVRAAAARRREAQRHDDRDAEAQQREPAPWPPPDRPRRRRAVRRARPATPPARTVRTAPKRSTTASPTSRAIAIVSMKPVVHAAARPAEVSSCVPQIDRRPVQARALREYRAEADRADEQRGPGRQREPRRRFLVLGGLQVEHPAAGDQPEQR